MASLAVYDAIRARLDPANGGAWTATTIMWPNEPFEEPAADAGERHWVAVAMTGTYYGQESIGAVPQAQNLWDEAGILWLHVMAPKGAGERTQRDYCGQLANLFRGETLLADDSLEFLDAAVGMGEPGDDRGAWWRISVSIEWHRSDA